MTADEKLDRLRGLLAEMPAALVCFSGGVDSSFLLRVAVDALRDRVVALTAVSPSIPPEEVDAARRRARAVGARRIEVESRELFDPRYAANPTNRCFYCKSELFARATEVAESLSRDDGRRYLLLDGTNVDDLSDHRPGLEAARAAGVRSPLVEADLRKEEIRALSRAFDLPTWDKPSAPCLASRLPFGVEVTSDRLKAIGDAERGVRALGFRAFRVRYHHPVARLELDATEIGRLLDPAVRRAVSSAVKAAGFSFVAVDLDGLRSGSLHVL